MGTADRSNVSLPSYDVVDPALSRRIDELLEELQPYPHLDFIREVLVTAVKLAGEDCGRGDLKILRSATKELRYAFKLFSDYRHAKKVTIFGSSRTVPDNPEYQTAVALSRKMAKRGYMVITGAGGGHHGGRKSGGGTRTLFRFEHPVAV